MKITIKESMLLRKCLNGYMLENSLEYDKSPIFDDLIHKLKANENDYNDFSGELKNEITRTLKRKSLNKELKKYSFQTICNKKILTLDKLERVESINEGFCPCEECQSFFGLNKRNK